MNDKPSHHHTQEEKVEQLNQMGRYDISNEAWREYLYLNDRGGFGVLRVEAPITLILDKRPDGDRHRLICIWEGGDEVGMYIKPGWVAIRWQTHDGKHGVIF